MFGFGGYSDSDSDEEAQEAKWEHEDEMHRREVLGNEKQAERWFKEQQGILISNLRKSTVIGDKMVQVLEEVEKTGVGTFAVSDELKDAPITTIRLKKDRTILRFPLQETDMEMLIPKFEMSPFGRGEKTLVDDTVRNSWQMSPAGFEITNKAWNKFITQSVSKIKERLGITGSIVAKPYKLLLYKTGSFFKPHRDSEKEEGMFGTLVIQLPSKYTGGELIVRHGGSSKTFDHSTKKGGEEFLNYYSAFYCDCEHEVLPLKSGARLCLIYNLVLKKRKADDPPKQIPAPASKKESFEKILKEWRLHSIGDKDYYDEHGQPVSQDDDEATPHHSPRLIYLLAHQYSEQSLSYANLKGTDKTMANFFLEMAEDSEIVACLGIMERSIFCNPDYGEPFGTEENGKPSITVKDPRVLAVDKDLAPFLPGSNSLNCGKLEFEEREVIPKSRFEKLKVCDSQINYTGNEGTEVTKQYKSSCILIFPSENLFFHCLESLDDSTAEKMFLAKLQKYKAGKNEEEKKLLTEAFLRRLKRTAKSYTDMEKWLKVFMEVGDRRLLSIFIKSHWKIINSNLKTFLSTILANRGRGNPLWDYIYQELNEQMKQLISSSSSYYEIKKKVISTEQFRSALQVINKTKDQPAISTFLQGYGNLLFVDMNEILPVIIGIRATIGDEFLRTELIKLFEDPSPGRYTSTEINWSSVLNAIISINDKNNHLLSKFMTGCSTPIKKNIDKFLPIFLQLRGTFGDQFIITELRRAFSHPPAVTYFDGGEKLKYALCTVLQFKDANLMSNFISGYVPAIGSKSRDVIPAILGMEALFGWKMISNELKKIIIGHADGHDPTSDQLKIVNLVLEKWNNGRQDVIQSCTEYVNIIFEKCGDWKNEYTFRSSFIELGKFAHILNLDMNVFLQSRNGPFIVQLLQEVADRNGKKLNAAWIKVGTYWFHRLKTSATLPDQKCLPQLKKLLAASGCRL